MTEENVQEQQQASNNLRNRLVGSIILVAAAVIIIPSVLDGQKNAHKDDFKQVPERGEFKSVQSAKPFPKKEFEQHLPNDQTPVTDEAPLDAAELVNTADLATDQSKEVMSNDTVVVNTVSKPIDFDSPAPDKTASEAEQKKPPQSSSDSTAQTTQTNQSSPFTSSAWVIQLGVFGKKANVTALEKKLNDAGFATFNRDIKARNGRTLTKVYVGPELDKNVLAKRLSQVNKLAGIDGKITSFTVRN